LLDWYRDGGDVAARMPLLSAYLGHARPSSTYWYYSDSRVIPMSVSFARVMGLRPPEVGLRRLFRLIMV
jgi:integrase/recombinase XerD